MTVHKTTTTIDLNCDMGEGMGNDEAIMPYISSANIACGYHAGDETTIWKTMELAIRHKVRIGAHVSYFDKENFGRTEMKLSPAEVYEIVIQQLIIMHDIVLYFGAEIHHVKPHGALYNESAKDPELASAIAAAVKDFDRDLLLFGLSGSSSISEAKKKGLKTMNEVFADRTYQDDGSLTPRTEKNALIENSEEAARQVLQLVKQGKVTTVNGKTIPLAAETVCIHGDGRQAVAFAKTIHEVLMKEKIDIRC